MLIEVATIGNRSLRTTEKAYNAFQNFLIIEGDWIFIQQLPSQLVEGSSQWC